jgi:flavorubredoxin
LKGDDVLQSSQSTATRPPQPAADGGVPVHEIVPGRIHRLGGFIELDGRITWAPAIPGRFTGNSCYTVMEDDRVYLIDTGAAMHRQIVLDQLKTVLPPGKPVTAFLTRSEYSCSGNLAAICNTGCIEELVTSSRNPFAGSTDIVRGLTDSVRRTEPERGSIVPLGASQNLVIIPSLIRLLTMFWVYDKQSKTMFTSDLFGHVSVASPDDRPVVDSLEADDTTYEQVRDHTLMRYHWLPMATTEPLIAWLEKIFDTYEIEVIAPTSGCVLVGAPVVRKHYELMVELLRRVPEEYDRQKAAGETK